MRKFGNSFGKLPSKEEVEAFKASPHFDAKRGIFVNRRPNVIQDMNKRNSSLAGIVQFFLGRSPHGIPDFELPAQQPDFARFQEPSPDVKIIWFGHSSMLVNLGGTHVLVDPVLAERNGPFGFMMKRFRKSIAAPKNLPRIDVLLLTHDHYDHTDTETLREFQESDVRFIVPLGIAAHLRSWGIDSSRIQELDWWQSAEVAGVTFTATPAQHFSGRSLTNQNKSLWASWVVRKGAHSLYFSGDSGYDTHYAEIGAKLGPFDVAFIESGQYSVLWPEVHLQPEDGIRAFQELKAKRYFPIHWGMFRLSLHAWYEPIERIAELAAQKNVPLVTPIIGEVVTLNDAYKPDYWWKKWLPGAR